MRISRVAAATAVLLAMVSAPSLSGAHAAESDPGSQLLLSYDGETWHEDLPALFEPTTLVPGDRLATTVFVRNASEDPTTLTVIAEDVELYSNSPEPFYDELALSVSDQDSAGVEVPFSALSGAALYDGTLDASQVVALGVALTFPRDATSGADNWEDRASFALRVTLAGDEGTIPSGPGGEPEDPGATLPGTGGTVIGLWWALVAIAAGAAAILFDHRRTRRGVRHEVSD